MSSPMGAVPSAASTPSESSRPTAEKTPRDAWTPKVGRFAPLRAGGPWPEEWQAPIGWLDEDFSKKHGLPGSPLAPVPSYSSSWEAKSSAGGEVSIVVEGGTFPELTPQGGEQIHVEGYSEPFEVTRRGARINVQAKLATPPVRVRIDVSGVADARERALALARDLAPLLTVERLQKPTAELRFIVEGLLSREKFAERLPQLKGMFQHLGLLAPGFPRVVRTKDLKIRGFAGDLLRDDPLPAEVMVLSVCPVGNAKGLATVLETAFVGVGWIVADASDLELACPASGMARARSMIAELDLGNGFKLEYVVLTSPADAEDGARGYALLLDARNQVIAGAPVTHPAVRPLTRVRGRYATSANREVSNCGSNPIAGERSITSNFGCEVHGRTIRV